MVIHSDNPRAEKVAVVNEVREKLAAAESVVLTEYRGLNVPQLAALRESLKEVGGEFKIYKNTLVRIATNEAGLELDDLLQGPTAVAFVLPQDGKPGDPVGVAKALRKYSRENEAFVIKGGVLSNRRIEAKDVEALADMPPREQLLAEIAGLIAAPMQQFVSLLDAVPRDFAYALNALIEKNEAA